MNITLLHRTWKLIERTQTSELLGMSDAELVQRLLYKLEDQQSLEQKERTNLSNYLASKTALIRDLAEARMFPS
ncbi:MAG: hypothetical protein QNJ70_08005 [Xenococcaceae cyanobacterium MO_207.B15]|nr:hypothetical protein [Xenococcaceae cyanobacterium MO_207.B15]MDJ0744961.1 hypothetical protein [Xenococcaceae cyanobacterium MO_167.B27]